MLIYSDFYMAFFIGVYIKNKTHKYKNQSKNRLGKHNFIKKPQNRLKELAVTAGNA